MESPGLNLANILSRGPRVLRRQEFQTFVVEFLGGEKTDGPSGQAVILFML